MTPPKHSKYSSLAEILTRLLADVDDSMEFSGSVWKSNDQAATQVRNSLLKAEHALTTLINKEKAKAELVGRKKLLDSLIDGEVQLYKIYDDDQRLCVGIKIMADEVRRHYDD